MDILRAFLIATSAYFAPFFFSVTSALIS
ncbi:hypothetical protein EV200_1075 [Pedobacter psychrotolerans]|uniref:Uncharacterized protein n=1 Tax=Pedobacter psychrotolerans TaxID=1843235 RepID=A0A4V6NMZ3_9SPHI|nr:hypothetical protein EV200_1075 [Pedobacter psychrotolerans]